MSGLSSSLNSAANNMSSVLNDIASIDTSNYNSNSNLWKTTAYQISRDDFDHYDKHIRKTIELELIDGSTVILKLWTDSVDNICEHTLKKLHFTWKWPFIKHTIQKYVSFDYCSKTYNINCTLTALTEFLELKYTSYAELMLKDTIKYG